MSEQLRHDSQQNPLLRGTGDGDPAAGAERLAATRAELDDIYSAADAILDGLRQGNSARFLEEVRQSGGQ